ncbi:MAG: hypothetical protein JXB88_01450, partial [Spirochaetales bacterium]|nr:hypothetical protein [Spirochaetales bacterium]
EVPFEEYEILKKELEQKEKALADLSVDFMLLKKRRMGNNRDGSRACKRQSFLFGYSLQGIEKKSLIMRDFFSLYL